MRTISGWLAVVLAVLLLSGCEGGARLASAPGIECDPDDGGLTLPAGFCALIVHDSVGDGRHLAVMPNGDIYVAQRQRPRGASDGGLVALRDTTGDGRADIKEVFGETRGTGLAVSAGYLFFSTDSSVYRYALPDDGSLVPTAPAELVVHGLPVQQSHAAKSLALDGSGSLWVNVGGPSNACAGERDRQFGAVGLDPCPELEWQGGVWRFDANRTDQHHSEGERWVSGTRNVVALGYDPVGERLWGVQHGRDQLEVVARDIFSPEENAERPAEELLLLDRGTTFSWPYCFWDIFTDRHILSPEYGGDGEQVGRCADFPDPVAADWPHAAPNDLLFYTGDQLPARYRDGVFIVFHGSWNRQPLPMSGYNVVFQPLNGTERGGEYEVFADGFAGAPQIMSVGEAAFRPTGIAQGPDGSIYVSDSLEGRIWRIVYTGM